MNLRGTYLLTFGTVPEDGSQVRLCLGYRDPNVTDTDTYETVAFLSTVGDGTVFGEFEVKFNNKTADPSAWCKNPVEVTSTNDAGWYVPAYNYDPDT